MKTLTRTILNIAAVSYMTMGMNPLYDAVKICAAAEGASASQAKVIEAQMTVEQAKADATSQKIQSKVAIDDLQSDEPLPFNIVRVSVELPDGKVRTDIDITITSDDQSLTIHKEWVDENGVKCFRTIVFDKETKQFTMISSEGGVMKTRVIKQSDRNKNLYRHLLSTIEVRFDQARAHATKSQKVNLTQIYADFRKSLVETQLPVTGEVGHE